MLGSLTSVWLSGRVDVASAVGMLCVVAPNVQHVVLRCIEHSTLDADHATKLRALPLHSVKIVCTHDEVCASAAHAAVATTPPRRVDACCARGACAGIWSLFEADVVRPWVLDDSDVPALAAILSRRGHVPQCVHFSVAGTALARRALVEYARVFGTCRLASAPRLRLTLHPPYTDAAAAHRAPSAHEPTPSSVETLRVSSRWLYHCTALLHDMPATHFGRVRVSVRKSTDFDTSDTSCVCRDAAVLAACPNVGVFVVATGPQVYSFPMARAVAAALAQHASVPVVLDVDGVVYTVRD